MSHDYHQGPADATLYDGCAECDRRAQNPLDALLNMDAASFQSLCDRMRAVEFRDGGTRYRSVNEGRVGTALYHIAILQERHGVIGR